MYLPSYNTIQRVIFSYQLRRHNGKAVGCRIPIAYEFRLSDDVNRYLVGIEFKAFSKGERLGVVSLGEVDESRGLWLKVTRRSRCKPALGSCRSRSQRVGQRTGVVTGIILLDLLSSGVDYSFNILLRR